jgi:hypothetical protein
LKLLLNFILTTLFIIAFSFTTLYADEIYLKDSKIIKCTVIRITDNNIEYAELNGNPFLILPKNQVSKIIYENGDVYQITDNNEVKQITSQKEKDINTSETKYKFYIILPIYGIGYNSNPDMYKWNKYRAQQYADYLKSADSNYSNCYVDTTDSSNDHLIMNFAFDIRMFFNNNFGIGLDAGFTDTITSRSIEGQSVYNSLAFYTRLQSYYFGISVYYKENIKTTIAFKPYFFLGVGLNEYFMIYEDSVSYGAGDDSHSGPYNNLFDEKYRSNSIGYHGMLGFGFDIYNFTFYSSLFIPYATSSNFKSGDKEMRFANGSKVNGRIAGIILQIGCAVNFGI